MFVIGPLWFVIIVSIVWWLIAAAKNASAQKVNIITDNRPAAIITLDNYLEQFDDIWRETLRVGGVNATRFFDFHRQMQTLTADLPRAEQDKILTSISLRSEEYFFIVKNDRNALKVRLGVSQPSRSSEPLKTLTPL